jgi:hypothetical protein
MGCDIEKMYIYQNYIKQKINNANFDTNEFSCEEKPYKLWTNRRGDSLVFDTKTKEFSSVAGYRKMCRDLMDANLSVSDATKYTFFRSTEMGHPLSVQILGSLRQKQNQDQEHNQNQEDNQDLKHNQDQDQEHNQDQQDNQD